MESFSTYLNVQLFLVFVSTFLIAALFLRWRSLHRGLPPSPWYIPFIGSPQLFSSSMHLDLTETGYKYGGMYTLHAALMPLVVLSDFHVIKEALGKQGEYFNDRIDLESATKKLKLEGSILFSSGLQWSARRRVALMSLRNFGMGKRSLESPINEEARYLCDALGDYEGKPVDPVHLINNAVSNIICSISYGQRYEYSDPTFKDVLANMEVLFKASTVTLIMWGFPVMSYFNHFKRMNVALDNLANFSKGMVKAHRETFDPSNIRDVIDAFILEGGKHEDDDLKEVFRDDLIWRAIHDMFAAGTDTTTNTLLWLIILMMKFPDVQAKVQQEVDDVIGQARVPSLSDRPSMPYTEATIMEIQRYRTVAPYLAPRMLYRDIQFRGFHIPKGTQIWVNLWAVLHDPLKWTNPESFDPTRFLSEDGSRVIVPDAFIPFGIGRRNCIGEQLARMELFIFFTNFMQRFTFSSDRDDPVDLRGKLGMTYAPLPYKTRVTER